MQEIDAATLLNELKQYFSYDSETGNFTWIKIKLRSSVKVGDIAGSLANRGYIRIWFNNKQFLAHRLAWLFTHGKWPDKEIDHIDGNRSNNKINNLRDVTPQENKFNIKKVRSISGYIGVSQDSEKWVSRIALNNKRIYLGTFDTPELASEAYQAAKLKYHIIGNANES